ncbi:hypothetical protein [Polyangium spumosum]|uniref:Uncharacterized protein n=1 Tax=Polyangium spumosum TaxID=889282 RepID=A0A6N7Q1L4_9BACT|nr:hypothetical protein [Polyangium spumosum]MRG98208.1 hypothetical protein [Polyangium spumosum]
MASEVRIALTADGIGEVKAALVSVRDLLVQIETQSIKTARAASKKRVDIYKAEAEAKAKIAKAMSDALGGSIPGTGAPSVGTRVKRASGRDSSALFGNEGAGAFADRLTGGLGSLVTKVGLIGGAFAMLSKGISLATAGLEQFGGFLVNDVIKPAFALEKFAVQMENSSAGAIKSQEVMDKSRAVQARWNIDAMEAAQAAASLSDKTGNASLAFDAMEDLAMLSKAYGASLTELADLTSAIYNTDQSMSGKDLQKMLFTQLAQGQIQGGKFTIKEIAGLGGELVKNFAGLAGNADVRMASIGAALQSGGVTGKADVSMTNLNSFLVEAGKKLGKGVLNKEGQIADLGSAIRTALVKSKGNMANLTAMGLSDTSAAFVKQFMGSFQDAIKAGGGKTDTASLNKAAEEATRTFEGMRKAAMDEGTVREAANKVMRTSGERLESAMNQIKDRLTKLIPQLAPVIQSFANKAPQIASAATTVASALLALASLIEKLIPETDTRTKRKLQKEIAKAKALEEAESTGRQLDDLDKQIEGIKGGSDSGAKMHALPGLLAKREKLAAKLVQQEAALSKAEEPEAAVSREEAIKALAADKAGLKQFVQSPIAGAAKVNQSGTADEQATAIIDYISKQNTGFDFSKWEGMGAGTRDTLERFRDDTITKQEENVAAGAKKVNWDEFTQSIERAAKNLEKLSDSAGDAARTKPLTER